MQLAQKQNAQLPALQRTIQDAMPCVFKASGVIAVSHVLTILLFFLLFLFFSKLLFHFKVYRERLGGRQKAVTLEKVL